MQGCFENISIKVPLERNSSWKRFPHMSLNKQPLEFGPIECHLDARALDERFSQ
jgi:hypothetical protein